MGSLAVGGAMIGLLRSRLEGLLEELRVAFEHSHESEHALAEAQRIAAIGSWEIDLPTGKLTGSDEFKRIFSLGRDAELPIGDLTDRIHRDDREHVLQVVQQAATNQLPFELEERVVLRNGDVRHIHVRGTTVAEDGQMAMWSLWAVTEVEGPALAIAQNGPAEGPLAALRAPFAVLDQALARNGHLVGGRFTVADINVAEIVRYAQRAPALFDAAPQPGSERRPRFRRTQRAVAGDAGLHALLLALDLVGWQRYRSAGSRGGSGTPR